MLIKILIHNIIKYVKPKINNPAAEKTYMSPHPASGSPSPRLNHMIGEADKDSPSRERAFSQSS